MLFGISHAKLCNQGRQLPELSKYGPMTEYPESGKLYNVTLMNDTSSSLTACRCPTNPEIYIQGPEHPRGTPLNVITIDNPIIVTN